MKYICSCCGEEKEEWPAIAYDSPSLYMDLSDEEKKNSELTSDFCIIRCDTETFYFIRAVLIQNVIDGCQNLEYGVWVSLGEKSFNEYVDNYDNKEFTAVYFGWLANYLPDYDYDSVPTNVEVDNSLGRPLVLPHSSHDDRFVRDCYDGISEEEAERRINLILNK
ncbi:hypothetical protein IX39_20230 [Chryseobacterium formosense]|uniref:DUF2199 domain-containing protein n=1 Tax=Chryseobacterium formosense TaxID=236814 RepID=A0A085YYR7_9FLAO|nr:DUF2199 domain-containing protein [Chryseobacterium formosense]KFE97330.1 hypothetical protein IX39_20230 [Chryseobacterium formosense]SFT90931.1 hypothetical protein SAMN05421857_4059 [Chryseobacterium formosense]